MPTRIHTEHAKGGQFFFGLPEYKGIPSVTINGTVVAPNKIKTIAGGINLATPVAQDDTVEITLDQIEAGGY